MDLLLLRADTCDLWAVRCLGTIGSPEATAALIRVLDAKADVETCDGVIPVRSTAVSLLGEIGDRSAVEPLRRLAAIRPMMPMSAGASGCPEREEDDRAARAALERLAR